METLSHNFRWTERVSRGEPARPDATVGSRPAETAFGANAPHTIPLPALLERLLLLARIELPCAVQMGKVAREPASTGPVRGCGRRDGRFWLAIGNLTLELPETMIDRVRLSANTRNGSPDTGIDIVSANGNVMARISSLPDQGNSAVWQDIMDTFDCA